MLLTKKTENNLKHCFDIFLPMIFFTKRNILNYKKINKNVKKKKNHLLKFFNETNI